MEASVLSSFLENKDSQSFLEGLRRMELLRTKESEKQLLPLVESCFNGLEQTLRAEMVVQCLYLLLEDNGREATKYSLILLRMIPETLHPDEKLKWKPRAQIFFQVYSARGNDRLASKIPGVLGLGMEDIDTNYLIEYVMQLLRNKDGFQHGLHLLDTFPQLYHFIEIQVIINILLKHRNYKETIEWVTTLNPYYHTLYIEAALHKSKARVAWTAAQALNLTESYAHVERMSQTQTLSALIRQKLWGPAMEVAENDVVFQRTVITKMIAARDYAAAKAHIDVLGLQETDFQFPVGSIEASQAHEREIFFQLMVPESAVHFVQRMDQASAMFEILVHEERVGMDCEWKPVKAQAPVSILQIACVNTCFIIDMLALGQNESFVHLLSSFFASEDTLKIGFSFEDDIDNLQKMVQSSFPSTRILLMNFLDLQKLPHKGGSKGRNLGLKKLVEEYLGKPLNKTMQISNWEKRPLTSPQLLYAALDAHVLLFLHEKMTATSENQLLYV